MAQATFSMNDFLGAVGKTLRIERNSHAALRLTDILNEYREQVYIVRADLIEVNGMYGLWKITIEIVDKLDSGKEFEII